ncbi:MAG: GNAT family N-acetyltransferase [Planctomycetota bacterium]
MNTVIEPAIGEGRIPALRLLFARFPLEEQEARLRDALAAGETGKLQLENLLLAQCEGMSVGAALVMFQSDGIALVWPPVVSCGATDSTLVENLLMHEICRRIDATSARLGQCLLAPDDVAETAILVRHGFDRATDMFFLARGISEIDRNREANPVRGMVTRESYRPENAARFARLVEETYQGSLDCQYLSGVRTGDEAIVSHKLSGQFNPDLWSLYRVDGKDAGVLLMNEHPEQDAAELVYLGVAPDARGQGLGRLMIQQGLRESAQRGRGVMFLAVDCENRYANALYGEFEFVELARRRVMLRRPGASARK